MVIIKRKSATILFLSLLLGLFAPALSAWGIAESCKAGMQKVHNLLNYPLVSIPLPSEDNEDAPNNTDKQKLSISVNTCNNVLQPFYPNVLSSALNQTNQFLNLGLVEPTLQATGWKIGAAYGMSLVMQGLAKRGWLKPSDRVVNIGTPLGHFGAYYFWRKFQHARRTGSWMMVPHLAGAACSLGLIYRSFAYDNICI